MPLSGGEVEKSGADVKNSTDDDLPPTNPDFTSPAMGGWEPDVSKYPGELAKMVQGDLEG